MKRSVRKIKKDLKMGRDVAVQNLWLGKLPYPLCIKLSEHYGLIKEEYQVGETIVSINIGEMIELSEPYKNGDKRIHYRNIWRFWDGRYVKEYDDDYGGELTLLPCDLIFDASSEWKKYDHVYREATRAEIQAKRR